VLIVLALAPEGSGRPLFYNDPLGAPAAAAPHDFGDDVEHDKDY
jgi:hypothetical protein